MKKIYTEYIVQRKLRGKYVDWRDFSGACDGLDVARTFVKNNPAYIWRIVERTYTEKIVK